jgi:hypothetical protein
MGKVPDDIEKKAINSGSKYLNKLKNVKKAP